MPTAARTLRIEIQRVLDRHLPVRDGALDDELVQAVLAVTGKSRPPRREVDWFPLAKALADVTGLDFDKCRKDLFAEAKLLGRDTNPDEVRRRYGPGGWWYAEDWRGKRGQKPTPRQVRQTWGNSTPARRAAGAEKAETGDGLWM